MQSLGRGSRGCKTGVEIPAHRRRCPQTSPKVAHLIVSSEFTVIRPIRLSQHLLSSCYISYGFQNYPPNVTYLALSWILYEIYYSETVHF